MSEEFKGEIKPPEESEKTEDILWKELEEITNEKESLIEKMDGVNDEEFKPLADQMDELMKREKEVWEKIKQKMEEDH